MGNAARDATSLSFQTDCDSEPGIREAGDEESSFPMESHSTGRRGSRARRLSEATGSGSQLGGIPSVGPPQFLPVARWALAKGAIGFYPTNPLNPHTFTRW